MFKKDKDQTSTKSYRGVNLIPSIGKVIDRCLLSQLLTHLERNQLVPHQHQGGVRNLGTATALTTLIDTWTQHMEDGEEAVALAMDQSLAYNLVDHAILIRKLEAIGLDQLSVKLMTSYLQDRQQSVQVESFISPPLHTGPQSVIQGSALSSTLYIIFTLDLPLIFYMKSIKVKEEELSDKPKSVMYIDDNFITVTKYNNMSLQESLDETVKKLEEYMANNKLMLNTEKTKLMVLNKKPSSRKDIRIQANPKDIVHSTSLKVLGIEIDHAMNWKFFLLEGKMSIAKQLKNRLNSLKLLRRSATEAQMRIMAHGIVMSKLEYGAEAWSAAPNYIIKILQSIQLEAARTVLGPRARQWSTSHLLRDMKWLSIKQLAVLASAKFTHKILKSSQPATLSYRIMSRINHTRLTRHNGPNQLGPKPSGIGRSIYIKYQYRANAYSNYKDIPEILREIKQPVIFKKRLKRYLRNNDDLPTNRSTGPILTTSPNRPTGHPPSTVQASPMNRPTTPNRPTDTNRPTSRNGNHHTSPMSPARQPSPAIQGRARNQPTNPNRPTGWNNTTSPIGSNHAHQPSNRTPTQN